jgi:hypothetical protein
MPISITKVTGDSDVEIYLDFFSNTSYDRFNKTF